ncbi:MAG: Uma2 family endonuclease [Leptolyngbyaceae cyanobacterium SM1_3_5]|nr:Uma2 family endonuclease [Leptolyngbyaceae cyanobacterium SM1_3_5]
MTPERYCDRQGYLLDAASGYPTVKQLFESFCRNGPESRLELIESRLMVGNSIAGSRLLLRQLLQGWGAGAAVALAPIELWIEALKQSFNLMIPAEANLSSVLDHLQAQTAQFDYQPEDLSSGYRGEENNHNDIRSYLSRALWLVAQQIGGRSSERDFVMRLGDNGFTPDVLFYFGQNRNQLCSWYLDGAAELVIEIIRPGHEYADRTVKRDYYAAASVLHYWLIDPRSEQIEFWALIDGSYHQQFLDLDGCYRPASIAGLAFCPATLWDEDNWYCGRLEQDLFRLEVPPQPCQKIAAVDDRLAWGRLAWGRLAFAPDVQLEATPLSFEQYICWAPPAKFEFWEGKPRIGGDRGIRNLIGMLLMAFGLTSSVRVLPPQAWIRALRQRLEWEQSDRKRKAQWWQLAHQAAALLRESYGVDRISVIGDLVRSDLLNYWSDLTLVVWGDKLKHEYQIYQTLSKLGELPQLNIRLPA